MKETRIAEAIRTEAVLKKNGFLGLNDADNRINLKENESKILTNVDSYTGFIEGRKGSLVLGRTNQANESLGLNSSEIIQSDSGHIDSIVWTIDDKEYLFVANGNGKIYYQILDIQAGEHSFNTLKFEFKPYQTNLNQTVSFDLKFKQILSGKFIKKDSKTLLFINDSQNITIEYENGVFVTRFTGLPNPDFIQNSFKAYQDTYGRTNTYERIYGIELIECAKNDNDQYIFDESNYIYSSGKVTNLPIRVRSSGINRFANTVVDFQTTDVNGFDYSLTYKHESRGYHKSTLGDPEFILPIWETLGLYSNKIDIPAEVTALNLHRWTHIVIWRSRALKPWGGNDVFTGTPDELSPVAFYQFEAVINAKQPIIQHPKNYNAVPLGKIGANNSTEAILEDPSLVGEEYLPTLEVANYEEMELQAIPEAYTTIFAGKRFWTPKSNEKRFDSTLFYSFSTFDYNGVYSEQIDVTRFISCNQGNNGMILGLIADGSSLFIFKEGESGYIAGASKDSSYSIADSRIGISSPNTVKLIPNLGIIGATSDQNRFSLFSSNGWTNSFFGGLNLSRAIKDRLKNFSMSDSSSNWGKKWVDFDYKDSFFYLTYLGNVESDKKPIIVLKINTEYQNGWTEAKYYLDADTRHSTPIFATFDYGNKLVIQATRVPSFFIDYETANYDPTKRQIQDLVDNGNENYFNHDQDPITMEFRPIKSFFDTSYFNHDNGRSLVEFKYLSIMAGLNGPLSVSCFLENKPWNQLIQPKVIAGFNDLYTLETSREYNFYQDLNNNTLKPIGFNHHFVFESYSPFFVKSIDLFCFITPNPQNDLYNPELVTDIQAGISPLQEIQGGMDIWLTRDNMEINNTNSTKTLYRPFIQVGSVNRIRE